MRLIIQQGRYGERSLQCHPVPHEDNVFFCINLRQRCDIIRLHYQETLADLQPVCLEHIQNREVSRECFQFLRVIIVEKACEVVRLVMCRHGLDVLSH